MFQLNSRLKLLATSSFRIDFGSHRYNLIRLHSLSVQDIRFIINSKILVWSHSRGYESFINNNYVDTKITELIMDSNNLGFIYSSVIDEIEQIMQKKPDISKKDKLDSSCDGLSSLDEENLNSLPLQMAFIMLAGYIISKCPSDSDYDKLSGSRQPKRRKLTTHEGNDETKPVKSSYAFSIERLLSVFLVLMEAENKPNAFDSRRICTYQFTGQAKFFADVSSFNSHRHKILR